jgi:nitrogen fixation NifU-like protein
VTDLYQKLLVDHGKHPRNFRTLPDADRTAEGSNPLCGDELTVSILLRKDRIEEIAFQGAGCAVSIASASMMTLAVKGQLGPQVQSIAAKVRRLVAGENVEGLGDLASLSGVAQFPARVKCALLAWRALEAALTGAAGRVTTE